MSHDALEAFYRYAERNVIRQQAADVLNRCMEDSSTTAVQQLVEGLVLAGPQSMDAISEILAETAQRKVQVMDDLRQVFLELERGLKSYGVDICEVADSMSMVKLSAARFRHFLQVANIAEENRPVCMRMMRNSKDLMTGLAKHIHLLEEIEKYLQDWLWGLAYQSARQDNGDHPAQ
jgi:hypothetical protein